MLPIAQIGTDTLDCVKSRGLELKLTASLTQKPGCGDKYTQLIQSQPCITINHTYNEILGGSKCLNQS